ncbi:hypothetical protein K7X08_016054 [Anisodus acutangulus]|uniref:Uncharacterized protein n=1 Tax=Anisodus acutangulus TaxID=402998 RepID=A0A9Q1QYU4_9SOLA|nr:hypothetical protein K7X08_016054 [Anisodus acutangulus]
METNTEIEKAKAREEGDKPVMQQSSSDGVFKNGKLIYENWNVVHNRKNKDPNNESKQLEQEKKGEHGNINNAGQRKTAAQSTSTANKFDSLMDLTEEQQRDLVVPDRDNNVTQGETSKSWVEKSFGNKVADSSQATHQENVNDTVQQSKESRKIKETNNTGIENNHKELEINDEHQKEQQQVDNNLMESEHEVAQPADPVEKYALKRTPDDAVEILGETVTTYNSSITDNSEGQCDTASRNMNQSQEQEIKAISSDKGESKSNKEESNRQIVANSQTISTHKSDEQQQGQGRGS